MADGLAAEREADCLSAKLSKAGSIQVIGRASEPCYVRMLTLSLSK